MLLPHSIYDFDAELQTATSLPLISDLLYQLMTAANILEHFSVDMSITGPTARTLRSPSNAPHQSISTT